MKSLLGAPLPRRARKGDNGYDFFLPSKLVIGHGEVAEVDTGIVMEEGDIPDGYCMWLLPRSSLGTRYGLRLLNSVGNIDSGYRGTIRATLEATRVPPGFKLELEAGERFIQGTILPFLTIKGEIPPEEERGTGGYGSTGRM